MVTVNSYGQLSIVTVNSYFELHVLPHDSLDPLYCGSRDNQLWQLTIVMVAFYFCVYVADG
jgi:hypothetical protein